jgi:hypothetical protein
MKPQDPGQEIKDDAALSSQPAHIREQTVRQMAYSLYEQRGRRDGKALDDWLNAESALIAPRLSSGYAGQIQEAKSKTTGIEFVKSDLETAITFSEEALKAQGAQDTTHDRANARAFYHTALRKIDDLGIRESDASEIVEKMDKLKSNLHRLGETL